VKIYKIANSYPRIEVEKLNNFLEDPNLQELSCVFNAKRQLQKPLPDFYGAVSDLLIDADKIRMINRDLYEYINKI
jgi:hypothetical protein